MAGTEQPPEEVLDLLVKELTEGLTPEEQRVLAAAAPQPTDDYRRGLERTAAAISLAAASADGEPLPGALRERLERAAQLYFAANATPAAADAAAPDVAPAAADAAAPAVAPAAAPGVAPAAAHAAAHAVDGQVPPPRAVSGTRRAPAGGWWAAAACLVFALYAWVRTPQPVFMPVETTVVERQPAPPEPTPEMQRAALLARADTLKIPLGATKDPAAAGVTGDVVWDSQAQRGFMRLVGLRPNDPAAQQYQVWIFDGDRDSRYPVDGGVFDAPADGQALIIPIHNVIPVHNPKAFAVTVEKAGGVVVSARDHVIVLAQAT
jgi:hypothetical protein